MKIWERFTCRAPQGARRYGQRSHGVLLMIFQPTRWMTSFASTFQPTRPLRGATAQIQREWQEQQFQPTRPLRGATVLRLLALRAEVISTHAPLAGRDIIALREGENILCISTHAPLAGRDIYKQTGVAELSGISTHAPLAGRDYL